MRRLRRHIDRWQQTNQDNGIEYQQQRVACLEVEHGHRDHDEGPCQNGVEVIPIISHAHELVDHAPENEHEQPEQARHDVAVGTIRKKEPQGEVRCYEQAASSNEEVGREVNECQAPHRPPRSVHAKQSPYDAPSSEKVRRTPCSYIRGGMNRRKRATVFAWRPIRRASVRHARGPRAVGRGGGTPVRRNGSSTSSVYLRPRTIPHVSSGGVDTKTLWLMTK